MTTIIVMNENHGIDEIQFEPDVTRINIGRRPSNDVCITDRSVSGRHARIERDGDVLWIEDLNSTNGTYVNGEPVSRQQLVDGDDVLVGKVQLKCQLPVMAATAEPAVTAAPPSMDDSFDESLEELGLGAAVDDDDELDESMRAALALYSDESEPAPAPAPAFADEDDDLDFSEDARLFAQSAGAQSAGAQGAPDSNIDDTNASEGSESDDEEPMTLTDRAKVALGRQAVNRPQLRAVTGNTHGQATQDRQRALDDAVAVAEEEPVATAQAADHAQPASRTHNKNPQRATKPRHDVRPLSENGDNTGPTHELDTTRSRGAVIQIKNGAKSGQILPIDKPVTTLGRPGIQIAAIMRKPDGYFLMHIESDDSVDRPTLNADSIGDEPVLLHSGDELNVAGIDVEFMLS